MINKRLEMRGFLLFDFAQEFAPAREQIAQWIADGRLQSLVDEVQGLQAAPEAFVDLFGAGGNVGTRVVRV